MQSAWVEREASDTVERYVGAGHAPELGLRIYSTRLLGRDPRLVLHGGGNSSVKLRLPDLFGVETSVMCVKGSGCDMATIEPAGLPAVRLDDLIKLRTLPDLPDQDMTRLRRAALIDPMAPAPSVELLLHAFVPAKFVDHTHANAVLSLLGQPDSAAIVAEVYGQRLGLVPYHRPGFGLAKSAATVFDHNPQVEGLILDKHGIFTFGADARQAYERMVEMVTLAENRLGKNRKAVFVRAALPKQIASVRDVAPILRGACAIKNHSGEGAHLRPVLEFRTSNTILDFVNGKDVARYARQGVVTPDHTIRTKSWPLIVPAPEAGKLDTFTQAAGAAAQQFITDYRAYFARHNKRYDGGKVMLDPAPRVALVPGLGLFGLGASKRDAIIAADIAQAAVAVITEAEAIGAFASIGEADLFDIEYWPLEQQKLDAQAPRPLAGQIAVITGGGGAIGAATAKAFAAAGAEVALLDRDLAAAADQAKSIAGALALQCDVTDTAAVSAAFAAVTAQFGGVDLVVSNAGAAWQGRIGEVDEKILRDSFELNFFAHQKVAQAAVKIMLAQSTGGCLLFNVSKQAVNPGANFGPYGLPKAATLFLMRQYALDYGGDGIRANAVNADRIRSGLLTENFIKLRAKARGLSEKDYMSGNLLGREVTADDVAQAFLAQALALKTTASVTTVDGGNIAAALR